MGRRRKEANRAEAIVRGIGALVLLLLLLFLLPVLPELLKGKNTEQMMTIVFGIIGIFVLILGAASVIGLVVWIRKMTAPERRSSKHSKDRF